MVIRVLLADDHAVLRDHLRAFMGMYPDIEVVGEASDGLEALAQVQALKPHVLLLDLAMPGLGGLEVLRRIAREHTDCRVVVLTQHDAPEYVLPALQAGACGYLLKKAGGSEVVQALTAVARGESVLSPVGTQFVIDAAVQNCEDAAALTGNIHLTGREREVMTLIGQGQTNAEIARVLSISPKTVHNIQRVTPQNKTCDSCHGNPEIFLREADLRDYEIEANKAVIPAQLPPKMGR